MAKATRRALCLPGIRPRASQARRPFPQSPMAQIIMQRRDRFSAGTVSLLRRTRQWLKARERLLSAWYARAQARAHSRHAAKQQRLGGAGAILLPYWWEYESPLKRRIALEAMLRRMFSLVPELHVPL